MFKLRVRCLSKNTGEVFYEYDTNVFHNVDMFQQKFKASVETFLYHLQFKIKDDCTFEATVIQFKEELSLFEPDEPADYNKCPVVF